MFYVKSSFVLFLIAFYIELSVFEGESGGNLNFTLCVALRLCVNKPRAVCFDFICVVFHNRLMRGT